MAAVRRFSPTPVGGATPFTAELMETEGQSHWVHLWCQMSLSFCRWDASKGNKSIKEAKLHVGVHVGVHVDVSSN